MDNTIREGDLVMVVRDETCGCLLGRTFRVLGYYPNRARLGDCPHCNRKGGMEVYSNLVELINRQAGCLPHHWLKKIPPLTEPESIDESREVTA